MVSASRKINRAPVPTLRAAVVAKRLGFNHDEALTVALLGRVVPVVHTTDGLRALTKDKPDDPASVTRYLEGKFGEALPDVRAAWMPGRSRHPVSEPMCAKLETAAGRAPVPPPPNPWPLMRIAVSWARNELRDVGTTSALLFPERAPTL